MEINITLLKKMGYYVATAAEAFRAYVIPTRYVEGHYLSGDDIHSEASGINKLIGMPEQASKNAALEDPSFEANQVASGYSLPWDSGDRKNPGL